MTMYLLCILGGLIVSSMIIRSVVAQRRKRRAEVEAMEQLGFRPCPEQKTWLEETIAHIENNRGYRYEVREPKRLPGEPAVYYYVKYRHRDPDEAAVAADEILFPLKRRTAAGLLLIMKPSSLKPGFATRMMGTVATGPWDALPDDLQRLELPPDLKDTNLLGALGPSHAKLYDLIDARTLSVVQGFGDAGGMFVQCRDAWCAVAGASAQIPFRAVDLIASIRPLL